MGVKKWQKNCSCLVAYSTSIGGFSESAEIHIWLCESNHTIIGKEFRWPSMTLRWLNFN